MSGPIGAPQRIFITGATGVVGAHAVPLLIAQGHDVTAIGRSPEKRAGLQSIGARAIDLDTFDDTATRRALEGITTVINLATHMPSSSFQMMLPWKWRENDLIRREGSAALVQAALAAGVQRFIQESFAPVYEDGGDKWIDECWPPRPAPYNRTTLDAERSAAHFMEKGGAGIVARFAGFYGPDSTLREMIGVVKKGYSPLPGAFTAYWSSIAHEDAATAIASLVDAPAGAYNVSDDAPITRREFACALAQAIGAKEPKPMPGILAALGGKTMELLSRSQRMSNAKLKAATGWSPRWPSATEEIPAAIGTLANRSLMVLHVARGRAPTM
jgi:nucleoside-diphosphate-sugar epimerase